MRVCNIELQEWSTDTREKRPGYAYVGNILQCNCDPSGSELTGQIIPSLYL